jgi:hypothetical protein
MFSGAVNCLQALRTREITIMMLMAAKFVGKALTDRQDHIERHLHICCEDLQGEGASVLSRRELSSKHLR